MKHLLSTLSWFSATALDLIFVFVLLDRTARTEVVAAAAFGHVVAASLAAIAVMLVRPACAQRSPIWLGVFSFALAFFVPVAGPIGLQVVARFGLTGRRDDGGDPWELLDVEEELAERGVSVKRRGVSASKIASILGRRAPEEAEQRFQAILQVKYLPAAQQVSILKLALKDASDEVRLFAFSRIEKFRTDLEAKIKQFSSELDKAEDPALLNLRLAESYHEIAYLQLAEGAVLDHALDQAKEHVLIARKLRPGSGPTDYLLGRILLRSGEYEDAIKSFQSAVRLHYPRTKVIPYLAECAFRQRRYDVVRSTLAEMDRGSHDAGNLQPLLDFWR